MCAQIRTTTFALAESNVSALIKRRYYDPSSLFLMSDLIFFHEEGKKWEGMEKEKKKEKRVLIKRDRENANLNSKGNVCSPRRI